MPPVFLWSWGLQSAWSEALAEEAFGANAGDDGSDFVAVSVAIAAPVTGVAAETVGLAGSRPTDR